MLVVAALDVELCAERVFDTFDGVEEYEEGMDLLPGTLCLVKVQQQQQLNFLEYLGGLAQLPYRFIVLCEESLAAMAEENEYKVVQDHLKWDDLSYEQKQECQQSECIGFKLSQASKMQFFIILRNESLEELIRNGRVSTDHLGRIIQDEVDQLDDQDLKLLEGYSFKRLFPPSLAESMNDECDEDKARRLIARMKWDNMGNHVFRFVAARAVLNASFDDQQQMQQIVAHVFECEDKDEQSMMRFRSKQKYCMFKHEVLVFFMDWLMGRGCKLSFDSQPHWLDKCTQACLNTNAFNLITKLFNMPNARIYSIAGLLHRIVQDTVSIDDSHLEVKLSLVLDMIRGNPGSVNSLNQDNLPPLFMDYIHVEVIDLLIYAGANVNAVDQEERNFVHFAAKFLPPEQLNQLLRYLVDHDLTQLLHAKDSVQQTPLFYLMEFNSNPNSSTLQVLASTGADFNGNNEFDETALSLAVRHKRNVEILQALVKHGADWRWRWVSFNNRSLLHEAAVNGNLEAVKYLVGLGCSVNALDNDLNTPLISAVAAYEWYFDNFEVVKFLLEHGADVKAANKQGDTALYYARKWNHNVYQLISNKERTKKC